MSAKHEYLDEIVDLMIRQSPAERPSTVESIKQLIMVRGTEAILLQKVSTTKQTVIPQGEIDDPLILEELRIVGFDWDKGRLTLTFSQPVSQGWILALHNMGSFSSVMNKGPEAFRFSGNLATIGAEEAEVQRIIDYFKVWIPKTTRVYEHALRRKMQEAETMQRNALLAQQREAEQRARVLRNVKL